MFGFRSTVGQRMTDKQIRQLNRRMNWRLADRLYSWELASRGAGETAIISAIGKRRAAQQVRLPLFAGG